jgi:hypothetical protein
LDKLSAPEMRARENASQSLVMASMLLRIKSAKRGTSASDRGFNRDVVGFGSAGLSSFCPTRPKRFDE